MSRFAALFLFLGVRSAGSWGGWDRGTHGDGVVVLDVQVVVVVVEEGGVVVVGAVLVRHGTVLQLNCSGKRERVCVFRIRDASPRREGLLEETAASAAPAGKVSKAAEERGMSSVRVWDERSRRVPRTASRRG